MEFVFSDIAKNLLVLKKSCEKSAKVLQSKTRKLNDVRNRLKELEKAEDNLKGAQRRVAEYQLRIVSLDTKVQYLEKDVADEREKSASLQRVGAPFCQTYAYAISVLEYL